MTKAHIMFRDESGKLHATPSLSLAADLAELCGSEVFARRALDVRKELREAFDRADVLDGMFSGDQSSFTPQQIAAIQGDDKMPIYRVKIEGRHKPILVKEDSAAKAKDRVATATALTAEEMSTAMEDGERVWKSGEPFPDDELPPEDKAPAAHKAKSETAHAE